MLRLLGGGLTALGRHRPWIPAAALLLGGCSLAGSKPVCMPPYFRKLDDHATNEAALTAARRQLKCMHQSAGFRPSRDWAYGYEQAFVDVARGASGATPAVPPRPYWADCYRTAEGHARAQEWFAGYTAGAARAGECYRPYNVVATSDGAVQCEYSTNAACATW
jgi:hypothetical protein